jgi:hypothetical protein
MCNSVMGFHASEEQVLPSRPELPYRPWYKPALAQQQVHPVGPAPNSQPYILTNALQTESI